MVKIFIACPANMATGGPELLHQLCYKLRKNNYDAYMYYVNYNKKNNSPTHECYCHYSNPYVLKYQDERNHILVVPEIFNSQLTNAIYSKKIFWWLSVDNFYNSCNGRFIRLTNKLFHYFNIKFIEFFTIDIKMKIGAVYNLKNNKIIHLVQSYYALNHCLKIGIKDNNVFYLSDYLSDVFIKKSNKNLTNKKENIVLYNPQKGSEFTKRLMKKSSDIEWVPLTNLTPVEMMNLMQEAKVYVDFGNHPGKDRIPREAAINGCCVITGKRGSAAFKEDVNIPEEFKFEDSKRNLDEIIKKIRYIFINYDHVNELFNDYRNIIRLEEERFEKDLIKIFSGVVDLIKMGEK